MVLEAMGAEGTTEVPLLSAKIDDLSVEPTSTLGAFDPE
jgi:hypothetical protein